MEAVVRLVQERDRERKRFASLHPHSKQRKEADLSPKSTASTKEKENGSDTTCLLVWLGPFGAAARINQSITQASKQGSKQQDTTRPRANPKSATWMSSCLPLLFITLPVPQMVPSVCLILVLVACRLVVLGKGTQKDTHTCLLYTSPSPRDQRGSRMPSSA